MSPLLRPALMRLPSLLRAFSSPRMNLERKGFWDERGRTSRNNTHTWLHSSLDMLTSLSVLNHRYSVNVQSGSGGGGSFILFICQISSLYFFHFRYFGTFLFSGNFQKSATRGPVEPFNLNMITHIQLKHI